MKDASDDFLVRRVLKGETQYFSGLVEKYEKRVYKTCFRFLRNTEDARDLSQEVFIRIYNNLPVFHGFSSLSTWIYKISVNTCLNYLRKTDRLVLDAVELDDMMLNTGQSDKSYPIHADPDRLIELIELYELLDLNLKKTDSKSKSIFSYRLFHQMPFKDIADKLKISPESARMNYSRTRRSIKESIREYQKGE
ncbi:MAG: RNA polymerase sigma factor [Clostridiaceae bacterium]